MAIEELKDLKFEITIPDAKRKDEKGNSLLPHIRLRTTTEVLSSDVSLGKTNHSEAITSEDLAKLDATIEVLNGELVTRVANAEAKEIEIVKLKAENAALTAIVEAL